MDAHFPQEISAMWATPVYRQSPIHSLPNELLSYIFLLDSHPPPEPHDSVDSIGQEVPLFNSNSVKTPLKYSAVCRHWRNVAQGTAALWTNICITLGSIDDTGPRQQKHLDLSHIISYLSLSRKYPLNILLDARDPDWDFAEPEITELSNSSEYVPPFSADDLRLIFSLLLPHLPRWRSLDVLTDTWAPMYTVLCILDRPLTKGAPLLESLTLMRCNDYISHSPTFEPRSLKSPELFSSLERLQPHHGRIFPLLRNLTLRGVHVAWSSLALCNPPLTSLELSSHSYDVLPTQSQFRNLLESCPKLRSLIIRSSGLATDHKDRSRKVDTHDLKRIANTKSVELPLLEYIRIGYRSALEGCYILQNIHAPNIRQLLLEDSTHPGDIDVVEADQILQLIAGLETSINPPQSALFPSAREITLKGVEARTDTFRNLFSSMPLVESLELVMMPKPIDVLRAMLPSTVVPFPGSTKHVHKTSLSTCTATSLEGPCLSCLPCPRLQKLRIRALNLSQADLRFIGEDFLSGRSRTGAVKLNCVDVHLIDDTDTTPADLEGICIFRDSLDDEDPEEHTSCY
ncbi:hypothetical protein C8R42DRAFT_94858 [Lentinula raphanica]|nr:hypothetical protein C8R42DRAFT_94858 [Lentinula raphanica]